jgi:hypothetical protein
LGGPATLDELCACQLLAIFDTQLDGGLLASLDQCRAAADELVDSDDGCRVGSISLTHSRNDTSSNSR